MNIAKMMKDLQRMQSELAEKVDAIEVEASSGGGAVTARMNGKKQLLAVTFAEDGFDASDRELLADLVVAAVNEAGRKVDEEVQTLTSGMAGGLGLPGLGG